MSLVGKKRKVYAVKEGWSTGIVDDYATCQQMVMGYPHAKFKSFPSRDEAHQYLQTSHSDHSAVSLKTTHPGGVSFLDPTSSDFVSRLSQYGQLDQTKKTKDFSDSSGVVSYDVWFHVDHRSARAVTWFNEPLKEPLFCYHALHQKITTRLELEALIQSLSFISTSILSSLESRAKASQLILRTDSVYLRSLLVKWLADWRSHQWQKKNGQPPQHLDLIKRVADDLDQIYEKFQVSLVAKPCPSSSLSHHWVAFQLFQEFLQEARMINLASPLSNSLTQAGEVLSSSLPSCPTPLPMVPGFCEVWCDGACPNNGQSGARAGVGVWWGCDTDPRNRSLPFPPGDRFPHQRPTNNGAELFAILLTLELTQSHLLDHPQDFHHLTIWSDSQHSINVITNWRPTWIRNQWRKSDNTPPKNLEIIKSIDHLLNVLQKPPFSLTLQFRYCQAHVGILGNEKADSLASQAALPKPP